MLDQRTFKLKQDLPSKCEKDTFLILQWFAFDRKQNNNLRFR